LEDPVIEGMIKLKLMADMNLTDPAQDRDTWHATANTVNHWV
jgi:hypothetical protein